MSYAGGDVYRGEYLHGLMHGKGHYFYFDGRSFSGTFVEGKRNGYGEFSSSSDGESFRGNFENNLRQGYGEQLFASGAKFCGQFYLDQASGWGLMLYADGSSHCGRWKTVMHRELLVDGLVRLFFSSCFDFSRGEFLFCFDFRRRIRKGMDRECYSCGSREKCFNLAHYGELANKFMNWQRRMKVAQNGRKTNLQNRVTFVRRISRSLFGVLIADLADGSYVENVSKRCLLRGKASLQRCATIVSSSATPLTLLRQRK